MATSVAGTTYGSDQTFTTAQPGGGGGGTGGGGGGGGGGTGGGGGGGKGGGSRTQSHLRLRSVRFAAARHGCMVEHSIRARVSSSSDRSCKQILVTFTGTIDQHADGQLISVAVTQVTGALHPRTVRGRVRVVNGRWTLRVRLPGRNHESGDRWRFALRDAGGRTLGPAEVDGGVLLEVEIKNHSPI